MAHAECCDLASLRGSSTITAAQAKRLGQLLCVVIEEDQWGSPALEQLISQHWIGGLYLKGSAATGSPRTNQATRSAQQCARTAGHDLPLFIGTTYESDQVSALPQNPQPCSRPSLICLAANGAPHPTLRYGRALGRQMAFVGMNLVFGPSLDAVTEITEPRDVYESFGDDLQNVATQASAFADGLHSAGTAVCAMASVESSMQEYYRLSSPDQDDDAPELESVAEATVLNNMMPNRKPDGIISSFSIPDFADPYRASRAQQLIIQRVFRRQCGFRGPVVSDCSKVLPEHAHCYVHAPLLALLSGSDMVVLPPDPHQRLACIEALHAAVAATFLPDYLISAAADRVSMLKRRRLSWTAGSLPANPQTQLDLTADAIYRSAITALDPDDESPLSDLPASAVLLVLTPSVPSTGTGTGEEPTYDPFETLGRAIAGIHPRTRHVPYVLSTGLTATHVAFLQRVNAVILVLCNASSAFSDSQSEFIDAVQGLLSAQEPPDASLGSGGAGGEASSNGVGERVKKVVLAAGDPRDLRPRSLSGWWKCCCYEYTKNALEASAEVLMGRRQATGVAPIKI